MVGRGPGGNEREVLRYWGWVGFLLTVILDMEMTPMRIFRSVVWQP